MTSPIGVDPARRERATGNPLKPNSVERAPPMLELDPDRPDGVSSQPIGTHPSSSKPPERDELMNPTDDGTADPDFIRREIDYLTQLGPRFTGSMQQEQLINRVTRQLSEIGLTIQTDVHQFTRWDGPATPSDELLSIDGRPTEVASTFPYSGTTGPAGVTAPLRRIPGPVPPWPLARGKIAVVPINNRTLPARELLRTYPGSPPWPPLSNPLIPAVVSGSTLRLARRAGVKAVIFAWKSGITAQNAHGQYIPFILPYQRLPAVFVAGSATSAVLDAARRHARARLVLDAQVTPAARTRSVWAQIPGTGRARESVLIVSHSDGVNTVEENGHIGLVSLARSLVARRPERTVVIALITGHLRIPALTSHGQATTRWLDDHPELWAGGSGLKAVGGLVIEHLGALEYRDDPSRGTYGPTGAAEPEILYASTAELARLAREEWSGAQPGPTRITAPNSLIQFGEGQPLLQKGIPNISLVTGPQYLLSTTPREYVDPDLAGRQIASFHRLMRRMDRMPGFSFGSVPPANVMTRAVDAARVLRSFVPLRIPRRPKPGD